MNSLHPIALPKPFKVSAPKLASVHVAKVNGGYKVQHYMTHGVNPKPFVFADPGKMRQHLQKLQASQWREPDRNEARAVTRDMNLGPVA